MLKLSRQRLGMFGEFLRERAKGREDIGGPGTNFTNRPERMGHPHAGTASGAQEMPYVVGGAMFATCLLNVYMYSGEKREKPMRDWSTTGRTVDDRDERMRKRLEEERSRRQSQVPREI
jgi:hypothetical protein